MQMVAVELVEDLPVVGERIKRDVCVGHHLFNGLIDLIFFKNIRYVCGKADKGEALYVAEAVLEGIDYVQHKPGRGPDRPGNIAQSDDFGLPKGPILELELYRHALKP